MDWPTRLTALLGERLFTIGDTDTTVGSAPAPGISERTGSAHRAPDR